MTTKAPTKAQAVQATSKPAEPVQTPVDDTAKPAAKAPAKATPKKRSAKKAASATPTNKLGYLQNKEGRVFIATESLVKQMRKQKFGLMKISKSVYEEALENGGLTDPIEEFDEEEDL